MKKNLNKIRTYSELIKLNSFEERFEYLKLDSNVGEDTFGHDRYLNQAFYNSKEWRELRHKVITRDMGCDLGISDREIIEGKILIHHMNTLTKNDIINHTDYLLNPEYLICTTKNTHDSIHYGNGEKLYKPPVARKKNDTCPWRQ